MIKRSKNPVLSSSFILLLLCLLLGFSFACKTSVLASSRSDFLLLDGIESYVQIRGEIEVGQTAPAFEEAENGFTVSFVYANLKSDWTPFITNGDFTANLPTVHTSAGELVESDGELGASFSEFEDMPHEVFLTDEPAYASITFGSDGSIRYYRNGKLAFIYSAGILLSDGATSGAVVRGFLADVTRSGLTFGISTCLISGGIPEFSNVVITEPLSAIQVAEVHRMLAESSAPTECEKNGHTYVSVKTPSSCTENAHITHTCTVCGDSYTEELAGTKLDHECTVESIRWTEDGDGWIVTAKFVCSLCFETDSAISVAEMVESAPADCITEGYMLFRAELTSDVYSFTYTVTKTVIVSPSHNLVHFEAKQATCTENGYAEYYECTDCHAFFNDEYGHTELIEIEMVPATGHQWSEWTDIPNGEQRVCSVCGETETRASKPEEEPPEDDSTINRTEEFKNACTAVSVAEFMAEKFAAIKTALECYYQLSETEKEAVLDEYNGLKRAIEDYNDLAEFANAEFKSATDAAFLVFQYEMTVVAAVALSVAFKRGIGRIFK